jgi:hypothetical protein
LADARPLPRIGYRPSGDVLSAVVEKRREPVVALPRLSPPWKPLTVPVSPDSDPPTALSAASAL